MMIAIHSIAESEALPFFSWKIYPANASSVYQKPWPMLRGLC
ncbi:hypothetical protein AB3S75_034866 [Citrus x aurantiifolia]